MEPANETEQIKIKELNKILRWVFKLYLETVPVQTVLLLIFSVYQALSNIVYTFFLAKLIDQLVKVAASDSLTINSIIPYILLFLGYNIIDRILISFDVYNDTTRRLISRPAIEQKFYTKLRDLGIQTLQQPEINNKISRSGQTVNNLSSFIKDIMDLIGSGTKAISTFVLLLKLYPIFLLIAIVTAIPSALIDKKFRKLNWKLDRESTEDRRKANASLSDIASSGTLEEIIIVGGFKFLSDKYQNFNSWFREKSLNIRRNWLIINTLLRSADNIVYFYGLIKIFQNFLSKVITVGDVTFQLRILGNFQGSIQEIIRRYNDLFESSLLLKDSYELYNTVSEIPDGTIELPRMESGPKITLSNVSFKYPNSDKYIFKNLNLNIKSGEKIAIVGHNGAGKTTLVRLITRMFAIQEGEILIDGINLNEIKIDSLYKNTGVLLQNYNVYPQLTVKENIYLGKSIKPIDEQKIQEAAQSADADEFIKSFKHGYEQILSAGYKEGTRPSTGQWQKIAIARFFYRNAPLVIFDEPTSSIDAVSEYNIFNKIYKFFERKTVIIISHRFSTVRNADRIIVLENGKIMEEGSHESLMKQNGLYAQAFNLQAQGYSN